MRPSFRRDEEGTGPKDETFELFLGSEIVGFILRQRGLVVARGRRVEMSKRDNKQQRHGLGQRSASGYLRRHNASAGIPGASNGSRKQSSLGALASCAAQSRPNFTSISASAHCRISRHPFASRLLVFSSIFLC